jgi:hypothetical protein
MRLAPHTAQHLLGTSSPVTVPRHPTGDSPGFACGYLGYWESQPAVGLPPVRGFPALQVLRPHRHSRGSRRFATSLPAATSRSPWHPFGSFPCSRSWTPATSGRWRLPDIPSALCGSPTRHRVTQVDLWRPFPPPCKSGSTASSVRGPRNALAVLIDKGGQGTIYP